ncbi:HD-GYP domain-containing protein [Desulfonispora thiosulfatigenes]|uniref:HD-GYP domain-containing protein n=1 Tax=Desulfonispora thiosulfatigenes TaxID=83661 RepID=UPI001A9A4BA9|nr:HD-GYP domain-containing protein [Desulfonispora thiosulfatigenes]
MREGQILGKSLYNNYGGLILKEGSKIKGPYIKKIMELGFQGLYIIDDISQDIEIKNVISDELKLESIAKIKNMFMNIENKNPIDKDMNNISNIAKNMADELVSNKHLMVNMIDIKSYDNYTYYHSVNVAVLSIIVGISSHLNRDELYKLAMGALLHDVGKIFISHNILNKNDKLTNEEFEIIKSHSTTGYKYLKSNFDVPIKSYIAALDHHEKYDGTGYPKNKVGENISLFGRIIAIADVYDALISDRPYRKSILPANAIEYIMGGCDTHFDFNLVNLFIKKVAAYPIGTCVKLNNGLIGIVVENFSDASTRPKIRILNKNDGKPNYINLRDDFRNNNLTIIDVVNM